MEPLSAQAAYGEVKKMQRFLDELSRMAEVLQVVAEEEKRLNRLAIDQVRLNKEIGSETDTLCQLKESIKLAQNKISSLEKTYDVRTKELQDKEEFLISETGRKLEVLKQTALGQVEAVRMELARLQPEVEKLKRQKDELEQNISMLKTKTANEMETMFNTLKKIGNS